MLVEELLELYNNDTKNKELVIDVFYDGYTHSKYISEIQISLNEILLYRDNNEFIPLEEIITFEDVYERIKNYPNKELFIKLSGYEKVKVKFINITIFLKFIGEETC